jgi:putative ABC transport system permease protein
MSLGATREDISRLVLGDALRLAVVGVTIGLGGALVVTRFLRNLLFEVRPADPWIFAGVASLLVGTVLLATWLPARQAAALEPVIALRRQDRA